MGTGLGHQLRGAQHLIYGSLPCWGLQILFGQPLCSHGWETFFFFSLWCSMTAELSYIPCDRRSLPAPLENGFLLLAGTASRAGILFFFSPLNLNLLQQNIHPVCSSVAPNSSKVAPRGSPEMELTAFGPAFKLCVKREKKGRGLVAACVGGWQGHGGGLGGAAGTGWSKISPAGQQNTTGL